MSNIAQTVVALMTPLIEAVKAARAEVAEVAEVPSWLRTPLIEAVNVAEVAEVVAVVVFDMPSLYDKLSRVQAIIFNSFHFFSCGSYLVAWCHMK